MKLWAQYDEIIGTYFKKDYTEICNRSDKQFFLPHHAVIKQDRVTTKIRIVFDGSSRTNQSLSLNDCLYKGRTLLNDLAVMLIKFRIGTIAVTSDLEEAFLQIEIQNENRDYLKFIWKNNNDEIYYRFKRLPFGLSCSPFVLNATLKYHCEKYNSNIFSNFYVDDFIFADDNENNVYNTCLESIDIMKKAGFNQRKWSTNSPSLAKLTPFNLETEPFNTHSVLGMLWNPKEDTLSLKIIDELPYPVKFTKRAVLSLLSRIFDPLGLYLPSTIRFRWFFSSLISSLSKWDEPLSEDQVPRFKTLLDDHRKIGSHTLPRCICPKIKENMRIHVFSDASSIAYGACVYLQYTDSFTRSSKLNLLRSRAKICTKNQMSIPRLELAATIVGVRLYEKHSKLRSIS